MAESRGKIWGEAETRCLIGLWSDECVQAKLETWRNAMVIKKIVEGLAKEGFYRSPTQVKVKMREMRYKYRLAKKENERSGSGRISCPFYDEMEDILGDRPATTPHFTMQTVWPSDDEVDGNEDEKDDDDDAVSGDEEDEDDTVSSRSITPPSEWDPLSADSMGGTGDDTGTQSSLLSTGDEVNQSSTGKSF
ncbi:zinc finger and SCAN domain-containing protein 29-like [Branchiostoma lanceolatum]|uniref:zinc finger and SCAN domain-containing protein 29-like n=1 Tax=Branchiostoma lanceolatum TaxID=7740 RepID=UPI00345568F7